MIMMNIKGLMIMMKFLSDIEVTIMERINNSICFELKDIPQPLYQNLLFGGLKAENIRWYHFNNWVDMFKSNLVTYKHGEGSYGMLHVLKGTTATKQIYYTKQFKRLNNKGKWKVLVDSSGGVSCTCPEAKFRKKICHHIKTTLYLRSCSIQEFDNVCSFIKLVDRRYNESEVPKIKQTFNPHVRKLII